MTATRIFTMDDQRAFARLSGDFNPIHVDEVAARRLLFGAPVVHGVHLTLWALDAVAATGSGLLAFEEVEAVFRAPVLVDVPATLSIETTEDGAEVEIATPEGQAALITLRTAGGGGASAMAAPENAPADPADDPAPVPLTAEQMTEASGAVPLRFEAALLAQLAPALAGRMGHGEIAALLATTRIVGMECPGLHSLYSELILEFGADKGEEAAPGALSWECTFFHPDLRIVEIEGAAPGVEARMTAFMRPEATRQITAAEARGRVPAERFAGMKALVVGGSRGLGEAAAKLLAAGGAEVTLTWASGQADADAIAAEIAAAGGRAATARLDVTDPAATLPEGGFTHLFYFAAPKIKPGAAAGLDAGLFAHFSGFFVSGLMRLAAAMPEGGTIFHPSTIFVAEVEPKFSEYAAAKAAAETALSYLSAARPDLTVVNHRFARLRTDQNAAIAGPKTAEPADALLEAFGGL